MHITSENYSYRYRYTSLCQQILKRIIVRMKYRRMNKIFCTNLEEVLIL